MKLGPLSRLLLGCALAIQAALTADWKQGKLLDISVSSTPLRNGKPAPQKVYTYSLDGGDKVYEAQEVGRKAPHVVLNPSIEYWVSKDYLGVRDSDGRVHKLALVKTTRKQ